MILSTRHTARDPANHSVAAAERRVIYLGMVINLVLIAAKLGVGYVVSSIALVADGWHSVSDLVTDVISLWGLRLAARPADEGHPYGYGKMETVAALLVAGVLLAVAAGIVLEAAGALRVETPPLPCGRLVLAAAGASIVLKELAYRMTVTVAERSDSDILRANAWHHRSDALSSMVVVIGAAAVALGQPQGDALAGILVAAMIGWMGVKLVSRSMGQLVEGAADPRIVTRIEEILDAFDGIASWHQLRTRRVGRTVYLDVHVQVDGNMTVTAGHRLSHELEAKIKAGVTAPLNIIIHIEPVKVDGTTSTVGVSPSAS
jgi:cation diffusion facilitator family transporter